MPEQPFIVKDRRKFTSEGELRPDADRPAAEQPETARPGEAEAAHDSAPPTSADTAAAAAQAAALDSPAPADVPPADAAPAMPPPPTADEMNQSGTAYDHLVDQLDTAVRAADPSRGPLPPVNFASIVHSVYMSAVLQLGLAAPEGQKPRHDILGARQSIDMLSVLSEKTKGNLTDDETRLLDTVLFELRLAFIETTQALSRSAQQQTPPPSGPSIVR